ncbi:MAG: polymer-forming cytoskeletal protein [Planctomycetes bacterium]|nr:polymer-forming cytoskeletal protein [Planctomycetota bacterium]
MPLISIQSVAGCKEVVCTQCGGVTEAAKRAMSIFCPHCHQRVILQDFRIRRYHGVVEFATCGNVVVEQRGFLVARVRVDNLTVKGKVHGRVTARGSIKVCKNGRLKGDVTTPLLIVENGGMLDGFVQIRPL